jgi:hypothetical protein
MKSRLIVVGSAPNATQDINKVSRKDNYDFMAIGMDAIEKCQYPISYVATNHLEDLPTIDRLMHQKGDNVAKIISYHRSPRTDIAIPYEGTSGSSAIIGVLAGIQMGYEKIVLCGCPLQGNAPEGNPYEAFQQGWVEHEKEVRDKVVSVSGWTKEFLGAPVDFTIGCCWDGGDYYPVEYINKLYNACKRNTSIPFEFVVYTGPKAENPGRKTGIDSNVRVVPVGLPSWWSGLVWWQKTPPGVYTDNILYLDLDQVIVGSLDDLMNFPSQHACMKDWPSGMFPNLDKDGCVSTTLIRNGSASKVWDEYVKAGMPQWDVAAGEHGPLPMACQELVNEPKYGVQKDLFPENWVCSYKLQVLKYGLPKDCRIVAFHGQPKQAACLHQPWVRENWT